MEATQGNDSPKRGKIDLEELKRDTSDATTTTNTASTASASDDLVKTATHVNQIATRDTSDVSDGSTAAEENDLVDGHNEEQKEIDDRIFANRTSQFSPAFAEILSTLENSLVEVHNGTRSSHVVIVTGTIAARATHEALFRLVDNTTFNCLPGRHDAMRDVQTPFQGFFQAVSCWVDDVWRTYSDDRLNEIKMLLRDELAPECQAVLRKMVPALQDILPEPDTTGKARMAVALRSFFRLVSDPDYPLVVVLDHIEHADMCSWTLISSLMRSVKGLIIVVTSNVSPKACEPLGDMLNEFRESQVSFELITGVGEKLSGKCMITEKLKASPDDQLKELLKCAACIGTTLDVRLLSYALSAPVESFLKDAANRGLIASSGGSYAFATEPMQRKAYSLIKDPAKFHLAIARRLLKYMDAEEVEQYIFVLIDQLYRGRTALKSQKEKYASAELCLQGAQRALFTNSFFTATKCIDFGIELIESGDPFNDRYQLSVALHTAAAEVYCVVGRFEDSSASKEEVKQHAKTFEEKLPALITHIYACGMRKKNEEAVNTAILALKMLDYDLPKRASPVFIMFRIARMKRKLRKYTPTSVLELPDMTDPRIISIMNILNVIFLSFFAIESPSGALVVIGMLELTLKYGMCAFSAMGFAGYGGLMMAIDDDHGVKYGRLGLEIIQRFGTKEYIPRIHAMYYGIIQPWISSEDTAQPLRLGHDVGMETGDHEYACLCACMYIFNSLELVHVKTLVEDCDIMLREMREKKQSMSMGFLLPCSQMLKIVSGQSSYDSLITPELCRDRDLEANLLEKYGPMHCTHVVFLFLQLALMFDDFQTIQHLAPIAWKRVEGGVAVEKVSFLYFAALASCVVAKASSGGKRRSTLRCIRKGIRKLRMPMNRSPHMICSKLFLLEALYAEIVGKDKRAARKFECAIAMANANGFQLESGQVNVCFGNYWRFRNELGKARSYYDAAFRTYNGVGAVSVASNLRRHLDLCNEGIMSSTDHTSIGDPQFSAPTSAM